jgi:hypothetical protein
MKRQVMNSESVDSLSDFSGVLFAKLRPLVEGCRRANRRRNCLPDRTDRTVIRPLFIIPPAAILRGGALSGTFHPNGVGREDMNITADTSQRARTARQSPHRSLVSRDALSLSPLRWPEHEAEPEPALESSPAQLAAKRASIHHLLVFPLVLAN